MTIFEPKTLLVVASVTVAMSSVVRTQDAIDAGVWRVPFRSPVLALPLTPYSLQRACAELAWAIRLPIGYESPDDQPWQPAPALSEIPTEGRTLADLLNEIVRREPRYSWTNQDGFIHVRPITAVSDPTDVLSRPIARFEFADKTLTEALREVRYALQPELRGGGTGGSGMSPTPLGQRTFSVRAHVFDGWNITG